LSAPTVEIPLASVMTGSDPHLVSLVGVNSSRTSQG
jgi:hypothetical protein